MQACPSPNPPPQNHCNPCRPCMMHSWQPIHRRWKSDCLHLRWIRARFSTPVGFSLRTRTMRDNMDPCRSVGLYQRTNLHAKLTYGWNFQEHIYIQKQVTSCHISHRISQFRRQRTPVPVPCSVPPWYMHSQTQTHPAAAFIFRAPASSILWRTQRFVQVPGREIGAAGCLHPQPRSQAPADGSASKSAPVALPRGPGKKEDTGDSALGGP